MATSTIAELSKAGDERRVAMLTLQELGKETQGNLGAVFDAKIIQMEKLLKLMAKSDGLRDQLLMELCQARGKDYSQEIENLHSEVARLEAKQMLHEMRLRGMENANKVPEAVAVQRYTYSPTVYYDDDSVDGSFTSTTAVVGECKKVMDPLQQTPAKSFKDSACVRKVPTGEIEEVKQQSEEVGQVMDPLQQTPAKSFKDSTCVRKVPTGEIEEVKQQSGEVGQVTTARRGSGTAFKPDAAEFKPRSLAQIMPFADIRDEMNKVMMRLSSENVASNSPEAPMLFKPSIAAPSPRPIDNFKEDDTKVLNGPHPEESASLGAEVGGDSCVTPSAVDGAFQPCKQPVNVPQPEECSETTPVPSASAPIEDQEEEHPEEAIIWEYFLQPMFGEPLGTTDSITEFVNMLEKDNKAETMDWVPVVKLVVQQAVQDRNKAMKAVEIYRVLTRAFGDAKFRPHLLGRCEKSFKSTLKAVEENTFTQERVEATLWFLASLYDWVNFGRRRELLGLAVCELLAKLAQKAGRGMTVAEALCIIQELLAFLGPQLKEDMDSKFSKEILQISDAVVERLSSFNGRMYKEQELARSILAHVKTILDELREPEPW